MRVVPSYQITSYEVSFHTKMQSRPHTSSSVRPFFKTHPKSVPHVLGKRAYPYNLLPSIPADASEIWTRTTCFLVAVGLAGLPPTHLPGGRGHNTLVQVPLIIKVGVERAKQTAACHCSKAPGVLIIVKAPIPCPAHHHQRILVGEQCLFALFGPVPFFTHDAHMEVMGVYIRP